MTVLVVGLYRGESWATWIWPWPDDKMVYIYVASLAGAVAAPFLWVAWSGEVAMLAPVALNGLVVTAGTALYLAARGIRGADGLYDHAAGALALALTFGLLLAGTLRLPLQDHRSTPRYLRAAMAALTAIAIAVGVALLLQIADIYPWPLQPETSTMFGIVYLGVVAYFVWGVRQTAWPMSYGQLLGFVAYVAVLVDPYLGLWRDRLADDRPATSTLYGSYATGGGDGPNLPSLAIFSTVLVLGTALAVWALLLDRRTRITRLAGGQPTRD